jgi:hypothetical protein
MTLAFIALIVTLGLTSASFATSKADPNDCRELPGSGAFLDSDNCEGPFTEECCYDVITQDPYPGVYP